MVRKKIFIQRLCFIGTVSMCAYIFRFLFLSHVSSNAKNQQLRLPVVSLVSETLIGSRGNSVNQVHPNHNKHDTFVSYPWPDDPACKNFAVQVIPCFLHGLIFCTIQSKVKIIRKRRDYDIQDILHS